MMTLWNGSDALRLEGLGITDPAGRVLVEDAWARVPSGGRCAFVCEESTVRLAFLRVLLRIESPCTGTVRIHGEDLALVGCERLRHLIAFVPARPILFPGSLLENVALGRRGASTAQIAEAVIASGLEPYVLRLPDGCRTPLPLAPSGAAHEVSRRVALARALLNAPAVLLVEDDPSDDDTGRPVLEPTDLHATDRTLMIVTGRPDRTVGCDLALEIRRGRIGPLEKAREYSAASG